ncbi:MAG: T9SS type A sorting domain-containing protein [Phycisphaerae bacterium]|nr:T9SS type A sorting domain-containing protein [Saprospiraceae bacterium]
MRKILTFIFIILTIQLHSQIVVNNNSFTYTENYDGLANTGSNITWTDNTTIVGWYATRTTYNAGTGSSATGALYSFGSTSSGERALGSVASGTTGTIYYGLRIKNSSGQNLVSITLSFNGEQWRQGSGGSDVLNFAYQIGATVTSLTAGSWTAVSALNYTATNSGAEGALDGNTNQSPISGTITLSVPNGQEVMLRWEDINNTGNDDGVSIDDFSISAISLPIELVILNVSKNSQQADLSFSTATEIENSHFSIQRSANGRDFTEIGQVKGAGTSYEPQDYTFTDARPLQGKNFYRLKQVDFDGKYTFSPVVTATFGKAHLMTLAPLPATETLNILLEKPTKEDGIWQVYDMSGRLLVSGEMLAETTEQSILIAELPEGAYVLRLTMGQEVMVEQFRKN